MRLLFRRGLDLFTGAAGRAVSFHCCSIEPVGYLLTRFKGHPQCRSRVTWSNTESHCLEPVRPLTQSDGHDAPGLVDELVPCLTAVIDEIVIGFEDTVGEPVVAHKLPDVLDRVELGAFRRQGDNSDVGRHDEARRHVPASLIDQEDGVGTGCDDRGDLGEMQVHRFGIAGRQDQGRALALLWADGAEDVGRGGPLITRSAGAGATLRPAAGDLVLLADPSLVREPYFYLVDFDRLLSRDCLQTRGKVFLKVSIAPAACA